MTMNVSMEGIKYLKKAFDTIKDEIIPSKYKDDYDNYRLAQKKLETTHMLLDRLSTNLSYSFKWCSEWCVMRDDTVCEEIICSQAFVNANDVSDITDELPDDAITMNCIPELGVFEFVIGSRVAIRLNVIALNSYGIAENKNPINDIKTYGILIDAINASVSDCEEILRTVTEANVSIKVGDAEFNHILLKYVKHSTYLHSTYRRQFVGLINSISKRLALYFNMQSQWTLINRCRIEELYFKVFANDADANIWDVDTNQVPDNLVLFNVNFKYSYMEVLIGDKRVIRLFLGAHGEREYTEPDSTIKKHEWCVPIVEMVAESINEIF